MEEKREKGREGGHERDMKEGKRESGKEMEGEREKAPQNWVG